MFNFTTMIHIFGMKRRSHERKEQKWSRPEVEPLQQAHENGVGQGRTTPVVHRIIALTAGYY